MHRLIPALVLLCSSTGLATTVYKTVDENGVVGFSDNPPQGMAPAEVLQVSSTAPQPPEEHLARLEAMREVTERLASDRRQREKHRAELREIRARTASYQVPDPSSYTQYADYLPVYSRSHRKIGRPPYRFPYRSPQRPPQRPGLRPKPEHPIIYPTAYRGPGIIPYSNKQLMRPLVSKRY